MKLSNYTFLFQAEHPAQQADFGETGSFDREGIIMYNIMNQYDKLTNKKWLVIKS
jgi:hypothetical protein